MVEPDRAAVVAERLLSHLNVTAVSDIVDRPFAEILKAQLSAEQSLGPRVCPNLIDGFAPVVDGEILPCHPFIGPAHEGFSAVPLIIGYNRTEMTLFSDGETLRAGEEKALEVATAVLGPQDGEALLENYRSVYPEAPAARLLAYVMTGVTMLPFVDQILESRRFAQAPTYSYRFDQETPVLGGALMSPHFLEIPYVFGNLSSSERLIGPVDERTTQLAGRLGHTWAAFAETGTPGAGSDGFGHWPDYRDTESTMLLSSDAHLEGAVISGETELVIQAAERIRERSAVRIPIGTRRTQHLSSRQRA